MALDLGFASCGVCRVVPPPHLNAYRKWLEKGFHGEMDYLSKHLPLKQDPRKLLPSAQSIIAVTLNYNQARAPKSGQPRIARYALGRDYHKVLRAKLLKLQSYLAQQHPDGEFRACVDSAPIMERDYAQLAGLGWFGKNTCLIDSRRGSWFFIGVLLTSIPFEADEPAIGGCGSCTACIEACPTGAIVFEDDRWQIDARTCISYLTIEHRGAIPPDLCEGIGDWTFGCDICQEVCPFNQPRESQPQRAAITEEADFLRARALPGLRELTDISEEEWDKLTRGSALRRAHLNGLRRNAKINLCNSRRCSGS